MVRKLIIPALLHKQNCTNCVADILKCIRIGAEIEGGEGGMKRCYGTKRPRVASEGGAAVSLTQPP